MKEGKGISRHSNPRRYNYLITKCYKLSRLAEARGIGSKRAVRDFKFWCEMNGLNPNDFFIRGYYDTGYYVPPEFVRWWDRILRHQGHLTEYDEAVLAEAREKVGRAVRELKDLLPRLKAVNGPLGSRLENVVMSLSIIANELESVGGDGDD